MFKFPSALIAAGLLACTTAMAGDFGRAATDAEIAGWDIDIRPDGKGLPVGGATAEEGEGPYEAKCAMCHGSFGEGVDRWPVIAGGGDLDGTDPKKTVGSYWPYASTLWDYINRAMPYPAPQSLTVDEVYGITAYVLYLNDLVDYDWELNQDTFTEVVMPNTDSFFVDTRPDVQNTRCFENCADPASFKIVGVIGGVSPTGHFKEDSGVASSHYGDQPAEEEAGAEKVALSADAMAGESVHQQACLACHGAGIAGAPKTGDKSAWEGRVSQGLATLVDHAINGYQGNNGYMPPKGGRMDLSDEAVAQAVAFMMESSQ